MSVTPRDHPSNDPVNPYSASASPLDPPTLAEVHPDAEAVRRQHLRSEVNVRLLGLLHLDIASLALLTLALITAVALIEPPKGENGRRSLAIILSFCLVTAILNIAVGMGLRRLRRWARWAVVAIAVPALLAGMATTLREFFLLTETGSSVLMVVGLIGSLIAGLILFLLLSRGASTIFSPAYQTLIAATPRIRPKSGWTARVLLLFLAIGMAAAVVGWFTQGRF